VGLKLSGQFDEVYNTLFVAGTLSVTNSELLLAVGGSNASGRQEVLVFNDSVVTFYYGPTGVQASGANKGVPIDPQEVITLPFGDLIDLYVIAATAGPHTLIIQEYG
jgi:hypothetical protein